MRRSLVPRSARSGSLAKAPRTRLSTGASPAKSITPSPYAAALKHVALRGRVALGPSARESEIALARAGKLPADYAPPPDTPWADTTERWSYAWQFPVRESDDGQMKDESAAAAAARHPALPLVASIGRRLLEATPSRLPGSAAEVPPFLPSGFYDEDVGRLETAPAAVQLGDGFEAAEETGALRVETEDVLPAEDAAAEEVGEVAPLMPAELFSELNDGLPVAYIDDGSAFSAASRALGTLMVDELDVPYDAGGMSTVIGALSRAGYLEEARAFLIFAGDAGLEVHQAMYGALMLGFAHRGDTTRVMALIEEMKERGLTPIRLNWHMLSTAFLRSGDCPAAIQVLDNMKALAGIEPDEHTFALHIRALTFDKSRESSVFDAVQVFDQMENVYGYLPTRPLYHAMMGALARSPRSEMRQRLEDLAAKMQLIGMPWDAATYGVLLIAAATRGDVTRSLELVSKMRDEGVPVEGPHLTRVVQAHTSSMSPAVFDYVALQNGDELDALSPAKAAGLRPGDSPLPVLVDRVSTAFGVLDLVQRRGWEVTEELLQSVLQAVCIAAVAAIDFLPRRSPAEERAANDAVGRFEHQATLLWTDTFAELGLRRAAVAHEAYISLLAHQQRIDEAEGLFQRLVLEADRASGEVDGAEPSPADELAMRPTRRTYEALMVMHLASGEEGGTGRALHYMDAMQRAGHMVRPATVARMKRATDNAAYTRDMKRRARRIMEAREEYLRQKAESAARAAEFGDGPSSADFVARTTTEVADAAAAAASSTRAAAGEEARGGAQAPLPVGQDSALQFWERWRSETASKHELFAEERPDGTPMGETFDEKNAALRALGVQSKYAAPADLPGPAVGSASRVLPRDSLLGKMRADGSEPAGALYALDGGDVQYPTTNSGPEGWGATFWRERQVVRKQLEGARDSGDATAPALSATGNAVRSAPEQLAIERTGAGSPGALADALAFPDDVYDDGTAKPASEMAVGVPPSAELVWRRESNDPLGPLRTDSEVAALGAAAGDNLPMGALEQESRLLAGRAAETLLAGDEGADELVQRGLTRRSRYDYLEKWREMYQFGTLQPPDEPIERFGRSADTHKESMAEQARAWLARNRRAAAGDAAGQRGMRAGDARQERAASQQHKATIKRAPRR